MKKQMIISILMAGGILLSGSILAVTQAQWNQFLGFINQNKLQEVKGFLNIHPSAISWQIGIEVRNRPLHLAAGKGQKAMAELFIKKGANVNVANLDGDRPLHMAARNGHEAVVMLLLDRGAEINAKNNYRGTPLHSASNQGHMNIVKLLVEKGANVTLKNKKGKTPAQVAKTDAIKNYLLEKEQAAQ